MPYVLESHPKKEELLWQWQTNLILLELVVLHVAGLH